MKKRIFGITVLLGMVAAVGMAQGESDGRFHVYVEEPGFLTPAIREAWFAIPYSERPDWAEDMKMVIHGSLDGSDFRELRYVMGDVSDGYYTISAHSFEVTELDLSDVHIVGHGWYGWSDTVLPETPEGCSLQRPREKVVGCSMFASSHELKRLVLPEETETVRINALFSTSVDDYSAELVLPANVKFFDAFQNSAFGRIVCKGIEPPVCTLTQEYWWDDGRVVTDTVTTEEEVEQFAKDAKLLLGSVTVVVPKGCREKYMQKSLWRYAKEIIEEGEPTDVKAAEADGAACASQTDDRTFRLDGRLALESDKGVVVRSGRKVLR